MFQLGNNIIVIYLVIVNAHLLVHYYIISNSAMNEEASNKSTKFRMEIRRRQREDIMKMYRQLWMPTQTTQSNSNPIVTNE